MKPATITILILLAITIGMIIRMGFVASPESHESASYKQLPSCFSRQFKSGEWCQI